MDKVLKYCDIDVVSEHSAVLCIHQGENISLERAIAISQQLSCLLKPPFNLIFDRKYHYSFDLNALLLLYSKELSNKIIVVCYRAVTEQMTELERQLCREDLSIVCNLDEAIKLCK